MLMLSTTWKRRSNVPALQTQNQRRNMHGTAFLAPAPLRQPKPQYFPSTAPRRSITRRASTLTMNTPQDLLIIGAGHLGRRVAELWRGKHPVAEILGETRTEASHADLSSIGVTPILAGTPTRSFPNVVFCAPPSAFPDYPEAVTAATSRVLPDGRLVFTSSTSVYGDANFVDEHTPRADTGRAEKLLHAENAVLGVPGGVVIRLAGLYLLGRGAHTYWFSRGEVAGAEDSTVNLIHYDDAAHAVVRALLVDELPERVFLASAERGLTRRDYVDAALRLPQFKGVHRPKFLNDGPVRQRRHDNSWTRTTLGWRPKFETFSEFVENELQKAKQGNQQPVS